MSSEINLNETRQYLHPQSCIDLEVVEFSQDPSLQSLVIAVGLGGLARLDKQAEALTNDFNVVMFSYRGSGNSTGAFTMDAAKSDLAMVIDDVAQRTGVKPFGLGRSIGGHTFAKLLEEGPYVERAVLEAPLLDMNEQHSKFRRHVFYSLSDLPKHTLFEKGGEKLWTYLTGLYLNKTGGYNLGNQRITTGQMPAFLTSILQSKPVSKTLKSPTLVMLTGGDVKSGEISVDELLSLEQKWKNVGADVAIYPDSNHWFSGPPTAPENLAYALDDQLGITRTMTNYLTS